MVKTKNKRGRPKWSKNNNVKAVKTSEKDIVTETINNLNEMKAREMYLTILKIDIDTRNAIYAIAKEEVILND